METKTTNNVTITQKEAQEYCAYKRQKKVSEIMSALRRSESALTEYESVPRLVERASRLKQVSVRMTPTDILRRGELFLKSPLKVDCIIGGNGETFAKVKEYEAKRAMKAGAKELTLIVTPSLVAACRYHELRKEVKRLRRVAKSLPLKVRVEKVYPQSTMSRLVCLCSELKVDYFSTPYYEGCHLLQTEPMCGCLVEVSGVEKLEDFKKMAGAGIGRIVTTRVWDIYTEWIKEADEIELEKPVPLVVKEEKSPQAQAAASSSGVKAEKILAMTKEEETKEKLPLLLPVFPKDGTAVKS